MLARPIIIGGFYRSGTSLLRRLLDSHSRIHCGPEVKFLRDFFSDYQNDPLAHIRFFATARSFRLTESELLRIFGNAFVRFHEVAAARVGKVRWADKNPENVLYLDAWDTILPDGFLFIHVVRHPLDALASLKEVGFPLTVPSGFEEKVALYDRFRCAGERFAEMRQHSSYQLRYERLVEDPEAALKELFQFIDEPFEPCILNEFYSTVRGVGIEDPKVGNTRNVHTYSVGRWKRDLSVEEIAIAQEALGSFMNAYYQN